MIFAKWLIFSKLTPRHKGFLFIYFIYFNIDNFILKSNGLKEALRKKKKINQSIVSVK